MLFKNWKSGLGSFILLLAIAIGGFGVAPVQADRHLSGTGSLSDGQTIVASIGMGGESANAFSTSVSISADGHYLVFVSGATNLVPNDTNEVSDIFVFDAWTGTTTLASVSSSNVQANGHSRNPVISADGRFVAFESDATNLVPGDTNAYSDIFLHDMQTGETKRVSVDSNGVQAVKSPNVSPVPSLSADGRYVAFPSIVPNLVAGDTNTQTDIFVHDVQTGETTRVSVDSNGVQSNGGSGYPVLSSDGRYVVFSSAASNLVLNDTNAKEDVFLHDRQTGTTALISKGLNGAQANNQSGSPSLSQDGRYIVFASSATNLITGDTNMRSDIFVYDRQTGTTRLVSINSAGVQANDHSGTPSISADGNHIVFTSIATNLVSGDTNDFQDVFMHDLETGITTRVSVGSNGAQAIITGYVVLFSVHSSMSADGMYVAFTSPASNLVPGNTAYGGILLHKMGTSQVPTLMPTSAATLSPPPISDRDTVRSSVNSNGSEGNGYSFSSAISDDGRFAAFVSSSTNLVSDDTNLMSDIFVRDLQTGETERVSISSDGSQSNGHSFDPDISADGRYVVFSSDAPNLVPGPNPIPNIYVHDRQDGSTECISVDSNGAPGYEPSSRASISDDGRYVAFQSYAGNLVPGDTNSKPDIFLYDRQTHLTTRISVGVNSLQANSYSYYPSLSGDGRYIAYESSATNLVVSDTNLKPDVFMYDVLTGTTELVSVASNGVQANDYSRHPFISADGRYVAFESAASNLVPSDTNGRIDVFVRDMQTGSILRVSVDSNSMQGNSISGNSSISANGRFVAFESAASNLVPDDTNASPDVFVHDLELGTTKRVSVTSHGEQAGPKQCSISCYTFKLFISNDGRFVTFTSDFTNLVPDDTNSAADVFVHRLEIPEISATNTPTFTPTLTQVAFTDTPTNTPTSTLTYTATPTTSETPTESDTHTPTLTPSNTPHMTATPTETLGSVAKPGIPVLISPVNASLVNGLQPVLDWKDSNPAAHHYQVQVSTNSAFTALIANDSNVMTSTFTSPDLSAGKRYYWRVRAFNTNGVVSGWSAVRNFKTPLAQPMLGYPLDGSSLLIDRPTFVWSNVDGASQYHLQVSASANFGTLLVNATSNGYEYTMSKDLPQNKTLYWRVRAKSPAVTGPWSAKWTFKTGNPPTMPMLAAPANGSLVKNYTPRLNWSDSKVQSGTTFEHYELQVDDQNDFSSPVIETNITISEFTPLTELASNTKFYWRVRAVNTVGAEEHTSSWSPVWSFRTVVLPPTGATVTPDGSKLTFDWDDAEVPITNYTIQISTSASFSTLLVNTTTQSSFYEMTKNLPSGKTLYWRVRVNGANGPSAWTTDTYLIP